MRCVFRLRWPSPSRVHFILWLAFPLVWVAWKGKPIARDPVPLLSHAWGVEVPDIPGCYSVGDDLDDAMAMAREAIEGHFEILAEDGAPIPSAQKVTLHAANPKYAGCMWAVVDIDVTKYLGKAQKLNITLPGYLLNRIDEYVLHHPEEKSRSGFLASAALKVLQQDR